MRELANELKKVRHVSEVTYHPPEERDHGTHMPSITFRSKRLSHTKEILRKVLKEHELQGEWTDSKELELHHPEIEVVVDYKPQGHANFEITPATTNPEVTPEARKKILGIIKALMKEKS